MSKDTQESAL